MTSTSSRPRSAGRTVPGPGGGVPLLGQAVQVGRDRLGYLDRLAREHGDIACFRMGPKRLLLLNHPAYAKHVLHDNHANYHKGIGLVHAKRALGEGMLTSDGPVWRGQRAAVQPAFGRERVAAAVDDIADEAARLVDRWRRRPAGEPVDVVAEMTTFTLAVLGRVLLRSDLGPHATIGAAFEVVQDQAMFEMTTLNLVPPWLPLPRNRRFRRARAELERMVDRLVEGRAADPGTGGLDPDVLARLLAAYRSEPNAAVRRTRLRDGLVTLLLAGHETTSSTLGWVWHLLDRHPDVAEQVRDEARTVLGDGRPAADSLRRLTRTTAVVEEALRLYPPVWLLPRRAVGADEIAGCRIAPGEDVLISPYTLHRNPAFWDRPERFDPGRFAPDRVARRQRWSYLPFGGGPRVCVGSHLGMAEAVVVTAMVARDLRLRSVPGRPVRPEARLSLRIRGGLPMTVSAD